MDVISPRSVLVAGLAIVLLLPIVVVIAVVSGEVDPCSGSGQASAVGAVAKDGGDGTPTILGPSTTNVGTLAAGFVAAGYDADLQDVIGWAETYTEVGLAEDVRGDWAFAQAVLETGGFTNKGWVRDRNPAGIAHYDGRGHGSAFASAEEGITAQIQLLKRFAAGNDVDLALPEVSPRAGAKAATWGDLEGTWASSGTYKESLTKLYRELTGRNRGRKGEGEAPTAEGLGVECSPAAESVSQTRATGPATGKLATIDGITVDSSIASNLQSLLAAARRDGLRLTGGGYRPSASQIALRKAHCGTSHYAIYKAPSSSCSPPTAPPGKSMHERGLAIDFDNCSTRATACYRWLASHAASYGFRNLPSESWHWSTTGS